MELPEEEELGDDNETAIADIDVSGG